MRWKILVQLLSDSYFTKHKLKLKNFKFQFMFMAVDKNKKKNPVIYILKSSTFFSVP